MMVEEEEEKEKRSSSTTRAGNLSPARWVSPTNPKLGPGWALFFLARKNRTKFSPARLARWAKQYWIGLTQFFSSWPGLKN